MDAPAPYVAACASCGRVPVAGSAALAACAACQTVSYCNTTCQKAGWSGGHKSACSKALAAIVQLGKAGVVAGDPAGFSTMGQCYMFGKGVAQNDSEAYPLLLHAAEAGLVDAMVNVGVLLRAGRGCKMDGVAALRWQKKAAATGNLNSLFNVAYAYKMGHRDVPADAAAARMWLTKAADAGHTGACVTLGSELLREAETAPAAGGGGGTPLTVGGSSASPRSKREAAARGVAYLTTAVTGTNSPDPSAHYLLGCAAMRGMAGAPDHAAAVRYFRLASAAGSAEASLNLGHMLREGAPGLVPDHPAALAHYKLAAAAGLPEGVYTMGTCYRDGHCGLRKNNDKAREYFKRAGQGSPPHGEALYWWGVIEEERGNVGEAQRLFVAADAAPGGSAAGSYHAGASLHHKGDHVGAAAYYRRAVAGRHPGALAALGDYYLKGMGGIPRDLIAAVGFLAQAAASGEPNSLGVLEALAGAGGNSVPDVQRAAADALTSLRRGPPPPQWRLATKMMK